MPELLEGLKREYETMNHEFNVYKAQRDDYEQKLESQLTEMQSIHSSLHALERNHSQLVQHYEGEISRMQQEAASKGAHIQPSAAPLPKPGAPLPTAAGGQAKRPREGEAAASQVAQGGPTDKMAKRVQDQDWNYQPAEGPLRVELQHTLKHSSIVCCVKFSNDGRYVAAGCNRVAYMYDALTGLAAAPVGRFEDSRPAEEDSYIRSVCFTADNTCLITGAEDKTVKVWDIATGRIKHTYGGETGHSLDIYSLDCSADGRFIASGSGDKTVKLWSTSNGGCLHTLGDEATHGPTDGVTSVSISPDGRTLAAGSLDKVVRLWDATTGQFLAKLGNGVAGSTVGHSDSVYSVAFSPDGKYLASGSLDHSIMLWDVSQARSGTAGAGNGQSSMVSKFTGHTDFVLSVAFNVDGSLLMSGSKDRTVQFWEPRMSANGPVSTPKLKLQGHDNSVISIAHSAVGSTFVTGSGDKQARVWRYGDR